MNKSKTSNKLLIICRRWFIPLLTVSMVIYLTLLSHKPQPVRAWPNDLLLGWTTSQVAVSYSVALGDYDGDGDLDIALGNYGSNSQIYRNDGTSFTLVWSSPTIENTRSVAWGDYDNDNDLDLAVGNNGGYNQVFRNNSGVFSLAWTAPALLNTTSVVWGDWNRDSRLDLITGNSGDRIRIFRNDSPTVLTEAWISASNLTTSVIQTFDWEGDSNLDLAVGLGGNGFSIYTNAGSAGGYALSFLSNFPVPYFVTSLDFGDWDNDSDLDLAVGTSSSSLDSISYIYKRGANFTLAWSAPVPAYTTGVDWGDYDDDGDLDLIQANGSGEPLRLYRNNTVENPSVSDAGRVTLAWTSTENLQAWGAAWGDMDRDTDPDLVVANEGLSSIYYNGNGPLTLAWSSIDRGLTRELDWGDWDNDGDLDLAVANGTEGQVYQNDGGTLNVAWTSSGDGGVSTVAWGDYDLDGYLDLLVGSPFDPTRVYHNLGGRLELAWTSPEVASVTCAAWGDYDGDGDLDLVLGTSYDSIRLYKNTGGSFTLVWSSTETVFNTSVAWGDYDGDGDVDLAVGSGNYGEAALYRNNSGVLTLQMNFPAYVNSLAWGDWDGDGDLDLAAGSTFRNQIYENNAGSFTSVWMGPMAQTYNIAWADYDGDGDLDLAFGNLDSPSTVYRNNSHENPAVSDAARLALAWSTSSADSTYSVAWGDYDSDGDLDLALGNRGQPNRIYRNETTRLALANTTGERDSSHVVAWGDYDGDGDLDLAVGNGIYDNLQQTRVYRYDAGVGGEPGKMILAWTAPTASDTFSLAWGDYDGDGDLDLFMGNIVMNNQLYRNTGGSFTLAWTDPHDIPGTTGAAWGDYDGDGDLDLAVGYSAQPTVIYHNNNGTLTPAWTAPQADQSPSLAWSDYDLDGDLDLAIGNVDLPCRLYRNDGGVFHLAWSSPTSAHTNGVAWGDYDGDGDPDLAIGNYYSPSEIYRNDNGTLVLAWETPGLSLATSLAWVDYDMDGDLDLSLYDFPSAVIYQNDSDLLNTKFNLAWIANEKTSIAGIAWADYDLDGDPDLATAPDEGPNYIYQNRTANGLRLDGLTTARIAYPSGAAAPFYASAIILEGPTIDLEYTLYDDQSDTVREVRAFYSLDAGSTWRAAMPDPDTIITDLATSPTGVQHTFTWDVFNSGFFGYSDQVVFRLDVYQGVTNLGPYQRTLTTARSLPFRVRGAQVRVTDAGGVPLSGARVYRLPAGETGDFELYHDLAGNAYATDLQGYLQGRGELEIGDRLVALYPITTTGAAVLNYTSAAPTQDGLSSYEVTQPGMQVLAVSPANPLVLFNLSISLEWDARQDAQYLARLQADLQRTAEFLYDWSNGQAALGQVTIYQAREQWNEANIRIYASNRLRPNASLGGLVTAARPDPSAPIIYYPGQVYMGATWNRYGDPGGSLGDDWPRTLAHELGHYALFLDDNYLGLDGNGRFIALDPVQCPSAMSDPYRQDLPFDEFHPSAGWLPGCELTLSNQATGRSDWQTIDAFYPPLAAHDPANDPNPGPATLPLAVTTLSFIEPAAPPDALADPTFYLTLNGASYRPGARARVFLFSGDWITDLGRPSLDTVLAGGAIPGDRLCVFEIDQSLVGCENVNPPDQQLDLFAAPGWQPQVLITPLNSQTTRVSVSNLPAGLSLEARLYPQGAATGSPVALAWNGSAYEGNLLVANWVLAGSVHVWVDEADPRRETVTDFTLGGSPTRQHIGSGTLQRGRFAPAVSADGQVILFGDIQLNNEQYYAIQAATVIPTPPAYATVVGQAYYLMASADAPDLSGASISISYMASEVPDGEEIWQRIYFWDGTQWRFQPTALDTAQNIASAICQGPGLYALMSSIEVPLQKGWNNIAFPIPVTRPVTDTLASIPGAYVLVYHYTGQPDDPWQLYAPEAPGWVNDLEAFEFAQGYWISATQDITLYLKGGFGMVAENVQSGFPFPPATYYGVIQPSADFTPAAGMEVTAWVDGHRCGQGQTLEIGGQVVYIVSVNADAQMTGCGRTGSTVSFRVAAQLLLPHTLWSNDRLWELDLHPGLNAYYPTYLPLVKR